MVQPEKLIKLKRNLSRRERYVLKRFLNKDIAARKKSWLTKDFSLQNSFVYSKAKKIVAQCSRRSGKSYGAGKRLVKAAYENPGVSVLYLALTRANAQRIMCRDVLKEIFKEYNINARENKVELTFTLDNGSIIYLAGADNSPKEMEKLLGVKYKEVVIDEAAFFKQDLKYMIEEIIEPALVDLDGAVVMISTTSINVYSYFFKVTNNKAEATGWEVHKWTAYDNPFIAARWQRTLAKKIELDPDVESTPAFRRMYKNEWVIDDSLKCYRFTEDNLVTECPKLPDVKGARWYYGLGIDLGWEDETSFTVTCWNQYSNVLYILYKYKKKHMDFFAVADYIKVLKQFYKNFQYMVIDGANKQGVKTMEDRFNLPLIAADKTAKREHIELFNSEMKRGRIKVVVSKDALENKRPGDNIKDPLLEEWVKLVWDEEKKQKGIYEELASCANHLSDSTLYAWRHAFNYTSVARPVKQPGRDTSEYMDKFMEKEAGTYANDAYSMDDQFFDLSA